MLSEGLKTDFIHTVLGKTGIRVHRLGLSASYRPGRKTIYRSIDEGLNYFFCYGFDGQMTAVLRDVLRHDREKFIVSTGAYNLLIGYTNLRRTLEKRLRQLKTDYIDVFLFLGVMKGKEFPEKAREEMIRFREEGKVRAIGMSSHDRNFAGQMAREGALDVMMIRYNAAHRGAEQDIFPHVSAHQTGIVGYTATRWSYLLRRPPKNWPKDDPLPTAGQCYRFVLSNPNVHVCLTAPSNEKQFLENIRSVAAGPLSEDEMVFMRKFGDSVHHTKKWFM